MYAKIVNEETKQVSVGTGTNIAFYKSIGMSDMEVEQAYNGQWYVKGYAPEKSPEEKAAEVRAERDRRIDAIWWRIERYQTQSELGVETTDSEDTYKNILQYIEDLRNIPNQEGFPKDVVWPELIVAGKPEVI